LHHDQLGSTRLLTTSAGTPAATYTYDPYGNIVASTGNAATPFQFADQYTDTESGLVYLRARYYAPSTGQFISRDPAVAETRKPYAYTNDNPLNNVDPSGLITKGACIDLPSIGIIGYAGAEVCAQAAAG